MYVHENEIIVNAENWYDAGGQNRDTTFVITNKSDLGNSGVVGYLHMEGSTQCAGYIGDIPQEWRASFGGSSLFTGWSSVYSIISRYSIGPSLWTFDEGAVLNGLPGDQIPTRAFMNFPYTYDESTHLGDIDWAPQGTPGPFAPADPLWNGLAQAVYGFFVPETTTFLVIGNTAGLETGIGYKAVQENGIECPGPCPYGTDDYYNYYWMFDIEEILAAETVSDIRPYDYGAWDIPFSNNGLNSIIGATYDTTSRMLYIALQNAGQMGLYDRPPLIVTFALTRPPTAPTAFTSAPVASTPAPVASTPAPVVANTPAPIVANTPAPVVANTPAPAVSTTCVDSSLRFKLQWNGRKITRNCFWVSNRATIQRCSVEGVSAACRDTCGGASTSCSACEDTTLRLKLEWNGRIIHRDCSWVGNRATIQRCGIVGVADACPVTCGNCS